MIDVDTIFVKLAGRAVIHGLSFTAAPGQLTAIIGPNGSGKTTTLRALSGERAYDGRIALGGRDLKSMSAHAMAMERGVLAQSISLGFPFKVREILEMGVVAGDIHSAAEAEQVMARALAAVDLSGFEDRVATALSGGEQARMHMARVLCQISSPVRDGRARWLFLDEPVASLDVKHQVAIMTLARAFARAGGGVLAVMHDLNLTSMFADKVVMLKDGRKHAEGDPQAVFTEANLQAVYGCPLSVSRDPASGQVRIFPLPVAA
jgi:iron complex transport system ATP-binding protein